MDRATFRAILMDSTSKKRDLYEDFLANVPLLQVDPQFCLCKFHKTSSFSSNYVIFLCCMHGWQTNLIITSCRCKCSMPSMVPLFIHVWNKVWDVHVLLQQTLDKYERSAIADVLEAEYYDAGTNIIIEGTPGDKFYFLEEVSSRSLLQPITNSLFTFIFRLYFDGHSVQKLLGWFWLKSCSIESKSIKLPPLKVGAPMKFRSQ